MRSPDQAKTVCSGYKNIWGPARGCGSYPPNVVPSRKLGPCMDQYPRNGDGFNPKRFDSEATNPINLARGASEQMHTGWWIPLGLQIAQCRSYLHTLGPKLGITYILGAPGIRRRSPFSGTHASPRKPWCLSQPVPEAAGFSTKLTKSPRTIERTYCCRQIYIHIYIYI